MALQARAMLPTSANRLPARAFTAASRVQQRPQRAVQTAAVALEEDVFVQQNHALQLELAAIRQGGAFSTHYTMGELLGQGTHAKVHAVTDKATGEQYAVKVLRKHDGRKDRTAQIEMEVQHCWRLQASSHASRLHAVLEDEHHVYLVQELCCGGDISDLLAVSTLGPLHTQQHWPPDKQLPAVCRPMHGSSHVVACTPYTGSARAAMLRQHWPGNWHSPTPLCIVPAMSPQFAAHPSLHPMASPVSHIHCSTWCPPAPPAGQPWGPERGGGRHRHPLRPGVPGSSPRPGHLLRRHQTRQLCPAQPLPLHRPPAGPVQAQGCPAGDRHRLWVLPGGEQRGLPP